MNGNYPFNNATSRIKKYDKPYRKTHHFNHILTEYFKNLFVALIVLTIVVCNNDKDSPNERRAFLKNFVQSLVIH